LPAVSRTFSVPARLTLLEIDTSDRSGLFEPITARERGRAINKPIVAYAVALLFFLQLLTSFVAANYALGLLNNRLPPESASAVFLLSPLLLMLRRRWPARMTLGLFVAVSVARLAVPFIDDTRAIVLVTGFGVAASLLLLALLLMSSDRSAVASSLTSSLALAVAAYIALRALGSGLDVSMSGAISLIVWPLAVLALWRWPRGSGLLPEGEPAANGLRVAGLCLGMMAALTLVYFAFSAPNVIVGWTRASHITVVGLVLGALLAWWTLLALDSASGLIKHRPFTGGVAVFGVLLVLSVFGHQVHFPADPASYLLPEPSTPGWVTAASILTLVMWPLILFAFHTIARRIQTLQPSTRQLALGFSLGAVLLATASFAQILTTTYDYVPVIGPVFRDRFWLVLALPAAALVAALFAAGPSQVSTLRPSLAVVGGMTALALLAVLGAADGGASPTSPTGRTSLGIVTFNVQQGYGADNRRSIEGQLTLLRSLNADIIGLQESDLNRVAGGNDDLVRYVADQLDLYSYAGPKTVTGTFGIALLSRYPLHEPRTFYLFSEGEQTAVIAAKVAVSGKTFSVFVTHLGNGGPLEQQNEVLSLASPLTDVLLLGDFNFRPDTEQYRVTTTFFEDAWAKRRPSGEEAGGSTRPRRIDYVFVSPGTEVVEAVYVDTRFSDHPALVVQIAW
jgi:endonuclease/exonuclease/phosphatase family metal-dependent hydrolase